jgi:exopolysaccharide biosynthesis polyprenyl glycosylphosphotransferase
VPSAAVNAMSATSTVREEGITRLAEQPRVREQSRPKLDARIVARAGGLAAVWLAVFVPVLSQRPPTMTGLGAITLVAAIWAVAIRSAHAGVQCTVGTALSTGLGTLTGLIAVGAIDPWFPGLQLRPAMLLCIAFGVWASAVTWEWFVRQTSAGRRRVLLVGTDEVAATVLNESSLGGSASFRFIGRIDGDEHPLPGDVPCLGGLAELAEVVDSHHPDIVVLTDEATYGQVVDRLLDIAGAGVRVVSLAGFFEHAFRRVPLAHLSPAWFMGILHLRQPLQARWSKRAFDLLVAAAGFVLVLPLLPLIALLVRTTPGPVIFRQTRLGAAGSPFTIYKFRTMVADAEASGTAQWCTDGDARVTRVGCLLRRTHLDEIPQLWNVLKGEMSIVGPRPERPEFVRTLEKDVPFWSRRLLIKPGVTGWAQLRTGYSADCATCADKLSYDLWYIRHRSLVVDLAVCLKTATLMMSSLFSRGTHDRPTRLGKGAQL